MEKTSNCFTKKNLLKRLPICAWLPEYNTTSGVSDLVAGITVGLTVIPQAIAYSNVAGMPPQIGLYSSFMGCFIYTILGSVKDSAIGPTAISGLLTRENVHDFGVDGAVLLCLLSGIVQLLMGCLQLGFLIDFISGPVSIGFTSAAAIIIATTQVKDILGLSVSASNFLDGWENIFMHITETQLWDVLLGVSCMVIILFLRVGYPFIREGKEIYVFIHVEIKGFPNWAIGPKGAQTHPWLPGQVHLVDINSEEYFRCHLLCGPGLLLRMPRNSSL